MGELITAEKARQLLRRNRERHGGVLVNSKEVVNSVELFDQAYGEAGPPNGESLERLEVEQAVSVSGWKVWGHDATGKIAVHIEINSDTLRSFCNACLTMLDGPDVDG